MSGAPQTASTGSIHPGRRPTSTLVGALTVAVAFAVVAAVAYFAYTYANRSTIHAVIPGAPTAYPVGIADAHEASGVAPPGPTALPGYRRVYVTNFPGTTLPVGWYVFTGLQAGSPGGHFGARHVVVDHGVLELNTWKDPVYKDAWVTGGLCQCGRAAVYGAYFVRSRVTGAGPNEVELLWPANNQWPPEIDFNETGGQITATSSTVHFGPINQIDQRFVTIDMTRWHTWGVIWTKRSIIYTVDGQVWGSITDPSEVARVPMTLDFEQRTLCALHRQCPTRPVSMEVNWVAEYARSH